MRKIDTQDLNLEPDVICMQYCMPFLGSTGGLIALVCQSASVASEDWCQQHLELCSPFVPSTRACADLCKCISLCRHNCSLCVHFQCMYVWWLGVRMSTLMGWILLGLVLLQHSGSRNSHALAAHLIIDRS